MVLSKKSWHFWLYKLFFHKTPENLCPYFWGVISSALLLIPCFILAIPWLIFCVISDEDLDETLGAYALLGSLMWFLLSIISGMFSMFFTKNETMQALGWLGWSSFLLLLIVAVGGYIKDRNIFKDSLVGKYVEAKKNKICPKIEWDEETEVL